MGGDLLKTFSHRIACYIDVLAKKGRFGMCETQARITDVKTGTATLTNGQPCGDRFKINIPYAGYSIHWYVMFNHNSPNEPPDFILSTEEDFYPDIDNLQSLTNWDASNPHSLLNVISELVEEYKDHQQQVISECSLLNFQYTSLLEDTEGFQLLKENVEVHVTKKSPGKIGPINFLMKLPVNFSKIPTYMTRDCPGEDSAVLLVTFQNDEASGKVTPQLYLSPRVEQCLGGTSNLRIPGYPQGGILLDYVPNVCQLLQNKVDAIVHSHEKRKEYISAFLAHFSRSVVEYDAESFCKISFIMEWHDFFFLVSISLNKSFPVDQPVLCLQSVYHQGEDGKPYYKEHTGYPYSPRWSPTEMAERTRVFILDNIATFQRGSVTEGSLQ